MHDVGVGDQADLNDDENWTGGLYQLAIELGPRDDDRLEKALTSVWRHASVVGCFAAEYHPSSGNAVPRLADHIEVELRLHSLEARPGGLRGVTRLPFGLDIVCGAVTVREDNGPDWLDFYVPLGALARNDPTIGGFPFCEDYGVATLAWRRPVDSWLAAIGSRVYAEVPYRLGLIGHEVSGAVHSGQLTGDLPERHDIGYLMPEGDRLTYREADR